jgi:hypothetical protein
VRAISQKNKDHQEVKFSVVGPGEPSDNSLIKDLGQGLGKKGVTGIQGLLESTPKPFFDLE